MKICLVNNLFKPYERGGAEKVVAAMIKDYQTAGHDVFLITTKPKGLNPDLNNNDDSINNKQNNLKIFYLNSNYYNLGEKSFLYRLIWQINNLFDFKKYIALKKILNQTKPDLVITHNLMGIGFMSSRAIKKRVSLHHHFLHDIQLLHPSGLMFFGQEKIINSLPAQIYQMLTKTFLGAPDLVISPSHWLLKTHQNKKFFTTTKTKVTSLNEILNFNIKARPAVIADKDINETNFGMPIDNANLDKSIKEGPFDKSINKTNIDESIKEGPFDKSINKPAKINTETALQEKNKKLLFAGQMEKHKGVIFLIKTLKEANNLNFKLRLAGDGKAANKARDLVKNDTRFHFLGHLNKEGLEKELESADYLIVPSLCYENSPTIIFEAKNFNLKVIAANLGGIPEIVDNNDYLFNAGDTKDLYEKIKSAQ